MFHIYGTVRMPGVRIGKDLDCTGAKLQVENQEALIAEALKLAGMSSER